MPLVTIPYDPRPPFRPLHELVPAAKRWAVLCCHRRAGKTVATLNHLCRDALTKPDTRYAFVEPSYRMAHRIVWDYVRRFFSVIPDTHFNESMLTVDFKNGSRISLFGSDSPDSLRGLSLDGVVFDEYSQQPPNIFGEIIRPALADRRGYAVWIGTIQGKNHLWQMYDAHKDDPEWYALWLPASASGLLPDDELASLRQTMSEQEYAQEMELDPTAAIKGSYFGAQVSKARKEGRICRINPEEALPVDTYWDLGMDDRTSIVFMQSYGAERRVVDYYQSHGLPLSHYVKVVQDKPYYYGTHHLPHDATVRELTTGRTREDYLKQNLKDQLVVLPRPKRVMDKVEALRSSFSNLYIDERLTSLIDDIERYRQEWDASRGMFKDTPVHDGSSHAADALMLWAQAERLSPPDNRLPSPSHSGYNTPQDDPLSGGIKI